MNAALIFKLIYPYSIFFLVELEEGKKGHVNLQRCHSFSFPKDP